MNKEEFLDRYKEKAVHCPTEELANEFLELCDKFGVKWLGEDKTTKYNNWRDYKKNTCYKISNYYALRYASIDYFKEENIEIIEFKKEKTMKFKDLLEKEVPEEILGMFKEEKKKEEFGINDLYSYINDRGVIITSSWENDIIDNYRLKHCYASKTEKECQFKKEKAEVIFELEQYAKEHNEEEIDWGSLQDKYQIEYDYEDKILGVYKGSYYKYTHDIHFTSKELAIKAIEAIGEDRIKKYLFGVE